MLNDQDMAALEGPSDRLWMIAVAVLLGTSLLVLSVAALNVRLAARLASAEQYTLSQLYQETRRNIDIRREYVFSGSTLLAMERLDTAVHETLIGLFCIAVALSGIRQRKLSKRCLVALATDQAHVDDP